RGGDWCRAWRFLFSSRRRHTGSKRDWSSDVCSSDLLVLYAGKVAECGPAETVLASPRHPYTKALFHSIPTVFDRPGNTRKTKLPAILGDSARSLPIRGCPFEPRCTEKMDICKEREPAAVNLSASHTVSCFKYES